MSCPRRKYLKTDKLILKSNLGINGVHRVVIDKNAPALPISLPIRQAPGLGLRLRLRLRLWLGLWLKLRLRLRLGILPREGIVPAAATSAQSQQGEEEHSQKSADTKLSAFHDTHSLQFAVINSAKYNP